MPTFRLKLETYLVAEDWLTLW